MRSGKMKDVVRYSEAFKLRLVEDVAGEKYAGRDEARQRNWIHGSSTLTKWI
jgi:transposase-like protein